jgi:cytoskeletal protein RodZ
MGAMTGAELKELRESQGITLEQAAEATCLRAGFLREIEEVADYEALPEVYRKLSFCMYARFLGVEMETTRRAAESKSVKSKRLIVPMTNFIRRMGRPPKPPRLDRQQRNRLLTVAKTTSAAVVVVLAIGLYSLNAKLARLNIDERTEEMSARHIPAEPRPQLTLFSAQSSLEPRIVLEEQCPLVLVSGLPARETAGGSK